MGISLGTLPKLAAFSTKAAQCKHIKDAGGCATVSFWTGISQNAKKKRGSWRETTWFLRSLSSGFC